MSSVQTLTCNIQATHLNHLQTTTCKIKIKGELLICCIYKLNRCHNLFLTLEQVYSDEGPP